MDINEARQIAAIANSCDGGCSVCVEKLRDRLQEAFPDFVWDFDEERSEEWIQVQER